jgi:tetratricopeptide (TPR) repeat protein
VYFCKGDNDNAIADITEAVRLNPNDSYAYYIRGLACANKRNHDHAIADYSEAVRLNPNYVYAYYSRGNAYKSKCDYDRAIVDYTEVVRLDPNYTDAYYNRGIAYLNKGDNDHAIADFNEAIRLNPNDASAYCNRGVAYLNKGDNDRAVTDITEAVRLAPNYPYAYCSRGVAYANKRDYDRAIADYNNAIKLNPNYGYAYYSRGEAYLNKGDNDHAITDYTEAIRLNPNNAGSYCNRGVAYGRKGDKKHAIADYEAALRLDPNNALYKQNLENARKTGKIGKLFLKSNVIFISTLVGVLLVGYFFIDAFTPDITVINSLGSVTIENGASLYVPKEFKVKTMDEYPVKWKHKFTADAISVLLSPGPHTFTLDFSSSDGDTDISAKDLKIGVDFNSGKYYRLNYSLDKKTNMISYSIGETNPVVYKSGFDPRYWSLIVAAIAFVVAIIFIIIARKKGVVYNLTSD